MNLFHELNDLRKFPFKKNVKWIAETYQFSPTKILHSLVLNLLYTNQIVHLFHIPIDEDYKKKEKRN